jgi:hypothetical protein
MENERVRGCERTKICERKKRGIKAFKKFTHLRPKPNAIRAGSITLGSGLNFSGSGYFPDESKIGISGGVLSRIHRMASTI